MTSKAAFDLPAGACDCHVHVFGDPAVYPYSPERGYTPGPASLADLQALHARLGISRTVIVQPSPYGADNSCTVDAVRALGDAGRGVAVIDESTTDAALQGMHEAGVRGVRVNLETAGTHDPAAARAMLRRAAERVAPLGWHVQTYTNLDVLTALHDDILALPTPVVVDHFGRAQAAAGVKQPGLDGLLRLLASGRVYVKISAAYRISTAPDYADVPDVAQALLAAGPANIVWGTDWPHPGSAAGGKPSGKEGITPFRAEDNERAVARLISWTRTPRILQAVLVDNPARLYDFA
jgi:predicted TIM-barrel fold metal-dependent hydrolase